MAVAYNEGGYNSTAICLDCILEAAATLSPKTPMLAAHADDKLSESGANQLVTMLEEVQKKQMKS